METRKVLLGFCLKYNNDWNRIYEAVKDKEDLTDEDIARAESFTGNYITIMDDMYPQRLKHKVKPPFVIYYEGDVNLLKRVDENGCSNNLIFLHGPNVFRIPNDNLCVITADNKIDICGGLRVWFNNNSMNVDRYGLVAGLCHNIVGTKEYPVSTHSWFVHLTIPSALSMGCNVFIKPTLNASYNNRLIKEGAFLIDSYSDIGIANEQPNGIQGEF